MGELLCYYLVIAYNKSPEFFLVGSQCEQDKLLALIMTDGLFFSLFLQRCSVWS
jgi:hypothetical protein